MPRASPQDQAPPPEPAARGPLTTEHHQELSQAQQRRKKLTRAGQVASFNAWSFAILAGLSACFALFSPSAIFGAVILGALAWNEFRGKAQLTSMNPQGAKTLGYNQCAFCLAIAIYCAYQVFNALFGAGPYAEQIAHSPELAEMLKPIEGLIQTATVLGYSVLALVGIALQGATAWYYFSRRKWVERYLQGTPSWIVELDRSL